MVVTQTITVARPVSADDLPSVGHCDLLCLAGVQQLRTELCGRRQALHADYISPSRRTQRAGTANKEAHRRSRSWSTTVATSPSVRARTSCSSWMAGSSCLTCSNVLPGVSMHTVLELASVLHIDVDEGLYSPSLIYDADEAFVSSTRYCMLPVATLNGYRVGRVDARQRHEQTHVCLEGNGRRGLRSAGSQVAVRE